MEESIGFHYHQENMLNMFHWSSQMIQWNIAYYFEKFKNSSPRNLKIILEFQAKQTQHPNQSEAKRFYQEITTTYHFKIEKLPKSFT